MGRAEEGVLRSRRVALRLGHPDPEVRAETLWWLVHRARLRRRDARRAAGTLMTLAARDPSSRVRQAAVYALMFWRHTPSSAPRVLLGAARDPDPAARGFALEALARRFASAPRGSEGFLAVVEAVTHGLRDTEPVVRFWAIYAVGALELEALRGDVMELVNDPAMGLAPRTVGEEARGVLTLLDTGDWPDPFWE